jgi:ATP-binding cassette subfamily F protein uup
MDKIVDHVFVFEGNGKISDFPGNYTQYRNSVYFKTLQAEASSDKKETTSEKKETPKSESPKVKKMSFNEKFEYEKLTAELEKLNTQKCQLELELNSGNLPHDQLISKSQQYSALLEIIEEKEFRWMELDEIRQGAL